MSKSSSDYFEQVAGQWDNLRSGYFTEEVRATAITRAYLRPEMVVADVGSGTGFMAAGLAPLVRQVHVLDGSPAMLKVARQNLSAFENVVYHEADGQNLTLPDSSVDAVFANMYLHHCTDPMAAIGEMTRILKPVGRLVITDMDSHSYTWLKEEMADVWMGFDRDQIRAWFKQADLVNVLVDCTGESCCAQAEGADVAQDERSAQISVFVAVGTKRLPVREAVKEAYGQRAEKGESCCGEKKLELLDVAPSLSSSSCCGDSSQSCCSGGDASSSSMTFTTGYSPDERAAVPREAEEFTLGCGNPTAFANLRPGEVVLDIGSGGGMDSFLAASRVKPDGKVIGVDMTPAMLERARATAKKSGIENVEFRKGQAEALPVEDNSIDVILSNCVINLCENKGQVFQEAFRALKPGGRLEVSDMVSDRSLPEEVRMDEWAGCVSGALPEQEYLDLVAQAGFIEVTSRKSSSAGETKGVSVYSITVSARKPVE